MAVPVAVAVPMAVAVAVAGRISADFGRVVAVVPTPSVIYQCVCIGLRRYINLI